MSKMLNSFILYRDNIRWKRRYFAIVKQRKATNISSPGLVRLERAGAKLIKEATKAKVDGSGLQASKLC